MSLCYHCGEPVPAGVDIRVVLDGMARPMCCAGCAAVAEMIDGHGLDAFYRAREGYGARPDARDPAWWQAFDRPAILDAVSEVAAEGQRRVQLRVDHLQCAACAWLIESSLPRHPGVELIHVNPVTGDAELIWRPQQISLGELLCALDRMGYPAVPTAIGWGRRRRSGQRAALGRLLVAGLGMMQVMMYALGLYLGEFADMAPATRDFLRWVALLVTTPVVVYSAWPFYHGAWRGLRRGRAGMDLPIALAVLIAYSASLINTFSGSGEVYFDSAVMFVFFMTLVRFIEQGARDRSLDAAERFADSLPAVVRRLRGRGSEVIGRAEIQMNDRLLVESGETVPADGRVAEGSAALDESLLNGESEPRHRPVGTTVYAGSVVLEGPLILTVERVAGDTLLSGIGRLMRRAQARRPPQVLWADRVAGIFVVAIVALASITALSWSLLDPARALPATLAVLVVTCPCALSLAVPVALAAARARLVREGVLVVDAGVFQRLPGLRRLLCDKTGTLTEGRCRLTGYETLGDLPGDRCLAIGAALEQGSSHPIARAFGADQPGADDALVAEGLREYPGAGVEGWVAGRHYRLGRAEFACPRSHAALPPGRVWLADGDGPLCAFNLADPLKADAAATLSELPLPVEILSGDQAAAVAQVAAKTGIGAWQAGLYPQDKLDRLAACQAAGEPVAALGDGINDAPLLAGADVGIAVGAAGSLARCRADVIVTGDRLAPLLELWRVAAAARRIARQNLLWAGAYNLLAVPFAAMGWVPPWLAAVGMSASSLLVVLNSLRLLRRKSPAPHPVATGRWQPA